MGAEIQNNRLPVAPGVSLAILGRIVCFVRNCRIAMLFS